VASFKTDHSEFKEKGIKYKMFTNFILSNFQ